MQGEQLDAKYLLTLYRHIANTDKEGHFLKALEIRNGKVTDFCPTLLAACACNMAVYWTGSGPVSSKMVMFYVLKYILGDLLKKTRQRGVVVPCYKKSAFSSG